MKLNKQNKNGSLSVVLPKNIVEAYNLNEGQDVEWEHLTPNVLMLCLKETEKQPIGKSLEQLIEIAKIVEESYKLIGQIGTNHEFKNPQDNAIMKMLIRKMLGQLLEKL